jgi:tRNA U34 5-methylaminomethyl-2-thiouridine-forming methyltransferase MnmC
MELQIITTKDNSKSIYNAELKEPYHSIHGALTESKHVYIKNGLQTLLEQGKKEINLFELGFGTGLNAFLSFASIQNRAKVYYDTIELLPLHTEILAQTNYKEILQDLISEKEIDAIFNSDWNSETQLEPNFVIHKIKADILTYTLHPNYYHIIYFDAFAPNKQPELWTKEVFTKMYNALQTNGFLVTYCARGYIKRTLKEVGFQLQKLNGPPGKREMTKAIKS